jgi:hypothetical protein
MKKRSFIGGNWAFIGCKYGNMLISTMPAKHEIMAFERAIRPLMRRVISGKTNAILGFRAPVKLKAHIAELAEKCTEGALTKAERAEYAGYVRANKFVALFKRGAKQSAESKP